MWIAFKLCIFDGLQTASCSRCWGTEALWIAFKLCIFDGLQTAGNLAGVARYRLWIAFKLCIFDGLQTAQFAGFPGIVSCELLSNFVSLTDCKQPFPHAASSSSCCELLSNFVSLTDCKQPAHSLLFRSGRCELLSNFVSLTDCKQLREKIVYDLTSCELLSNFVSLTDCKQLVSRKRRRTCVVNCFQTLYLWRTANSFTLLRLSNLLLWIAFKLCIFDGLQTAGCL